MSERSLQEIASIEDLQRIVSEFNASFSAWREKFGMLANFTWTYEKDDYESPGKDLSISSIDRLVYRRQPMSPSQLSARLGEPLAKEQEYQKN
jgi:hypothetical protein